MYLSRSFSKSPSPKLSRTFGSISEAGDGSRTRDPQLGKLSHTVLRSALLCPFTPSQSQRPPDRQHRSKPKYRFACTFLVPLVVLLLAAPASALSISTARQVVWAQAERQWQVYGSVGTYNVYGCHRKISAPNHSGGRKAFGEKEYAAQKPRGSVGRESAPIICFAWADASTGRCWWRSRTWQVQSAIFYRHSDPVCRGPR